MLRSVLNSLISLVVPPRTSEQVVESLTLEDLQMLATEDGLPYRDPNVRALVWEIKYYASSRALALAGEYLADELLAIAAEELGQPLLVPVPMHATRRQERGHNQTEVLCEAALPHLSNAYIYRKDVLKRVVDTPHQQGLARTKRLKNVEGSMSTRDVEGRVCVVVDDVSTTGATLSEAKRALLAAGARRVHCVALAR